MRRRLSGIAPRRLGTSRAYITLPPELSVIYDPTKLILQHSQAGRVVSMYAEIELEDNDPATTPYEGNE